MTKPRFGPCLFCDEASRYEKEDVLPVWLAEVLRQMNPGMKYDSHRMRVREGRIDRQHISRGHGSVAGVHKLPIVCRSCNGGWMSEIEQHAKPILTPLVQGLRTTLTVQDQYTVSLWMTLKSLMYELLDWSHHFIRPEYFQTFFTIRKPPPNFRVCLAEFGGGLNQVASYVRVPLIGHESDKPPTPGPNLQLLTLIFGHLVIQSVLPFDGTVSALRYEPPTPTTTFVSIWPTQRTSTWPPRKRMSEPLFRVFAHMEQSS